MTDPRDGPGYDFHGPLDALRRAWTAYQRPPCLVAPRSKLLYFPVLKAGTSTIIRALAAHEGVEPKGGAFEWARPEDPRADFPGWTSFTVVRDPWTRLASCYRDKIVGRMDGHDGDRQALYNGFDRYNNMLKIELFWLGMTFPQFVRRVCWIPDIAADPHIRSQFRRFTRPDGLCLVDRIFGIEQPYLIEGFLRQHSVLAEEQPLSHERRTDGPHWRTMYNARTARMVGRRYARDARMLGYRDPFDTRDEAHMLLMRGP